MLNPQTLHLPDLPDIALKNALRLALSRPNAADTAPSLEWFNPLLFKKVNTSEGDIVAIVLPHAFYLGWLKQHDALAVAEMEQSIMALYGPQTRLFYTLPGSIIPLSTSTAESNKQSPVSTAPASGHALDMLDNLSHSLNVDASIFIEATSLPNLRSVPKTNYSPPSPDSSATSTSLTAFDAFLSSGKNQFIYALLKDAAENGVPYNPIFLKGTSGTGKTHLLRAVAAALASRLAPALGSSRVALLSATDFSSLFPSGDEHSRVAASRALLRSAEAFCMDDVHMLTEQPRAQEELIALLDYFMDRAKPIIITFSGTVSAQGIAFSGYAQNSSPYPGQSFPPLLSSPLLARLSSGMTLELAEPDLDVRIRYAQNQLQENGLRPNKENAMFLARRCPNLRHLRGAVLRMAAFRVHTGQLPDETDMDTILNSTGNPHALTPEAVLTLVATHCGYSARDLRGKKRDPRMVQARQIAMFLCRELLGESYPALGRLFGGKDHSTVMYSVKKIRETQVTNKDVHILVTELTQRCQNYLFPS